MYEDIYSTVDVLKNIMQAYHDALELTGGEGREPLGDFFCRIGKKIKVAMFGGFSSGKTTFISRLLKMYSGSVSAFPETSTIIKHSGASARSYHVDFKEKYNDTGGLFGDFLREFDLIDGFQQNTKTEWKVINSDYFFKTSWKPDVFNDFLCKLKPYSDIVKMIEVNHYISPNKFSLLKYCDIYDVPGIGGEVAHEVVVDQAALSLESFDVILYLIDTDRGSLHQNELQFIESTFAKIEDANVREKWFWVYQKELAKITSHAGISSLARENVSSSFDSLNEANAVKKKFQNTFVLNAVGGVSNHETAIASFSAAIGVFLRGFFDKFSSLNAFSRDDRAEFVFFKLVNGRPYDLLSHVYSGVYSFALAYGKEDSSSLNSKDFINFLMDHVFFLDLNGVQFGENCKNVMLAQMDLIDTMVKHISQHLLVPKKMFSSERTIDHNYLVYTLRKDLLEEPCISGLNAVLIVHFYRLLCSGVLPSVYTAPICGSILRSLELHIKTLSEEVDALLSSLIIS